MTEKKQEVSGTGDPTVVSLRVRNIDRIVQVQGSFERAPQTYETLTPILHAPDLTAEVLSETQVSVHGDFHFEGRAAPSDRTNEEELGQVIVRIQARFVAFYGIDEGPEFPPESLAAFALLNGQLNIWPYWRQYVQDCLTRAGMSVFTLPPFNPVRMSRESKSEEDETT